MKSKKNSDKPDKEMKDNQDNLMRNIGLEKRNQKRGDFSFNWKRKSMLNKCE